MINNYKPLMLNTMIVSFRIGVSTSLLSVCSYFTKQYSETGSFSEAISNTNSKVDEVANGVIDTSVEVVGDGLSWGASSLWKKLAFPLAKRFLNLTPEIVSDLAKVILTGLADATKETLEKNWPEPPKNRQGTIDIALEKLKKTPTSHLFAAGVGIVLVAIVYKISSDKKFRNKLYQAATACQNIGFSKKGTTQI